MASYPLCICMAECLQTEQSRHIESCIYQSVPLCWMEALGCNPSPLLFLCVCPDTGWQRGVYYWMFAVCCRVSTRCFCHTSSFPPQEHFCWDLSHPGFSSLSFCISSPRGITEADEGVSGCSLQLCCAFLVTPPFSNLSLSLSLLSCVCFSFNIFMLATQ